MALRILLVEDNPDHALLTRLALARDRRIGEVEVAPDPAGVVASVGARPPAARPDVILVDLKLPGLSGFEVLDALKADAATRAIPVIILSTSAREDEIAQGMSRGARAFLTKPLQVEAFLDALGTGA